MSDYKVFYDAIDEIRSFLSRDLIGPIEENEVIDSVEPLSYYAVGILWAKRLQNADEEIYEQEDVTNITDSDIEDIVQADNDMIVKANTYKPPTMGVSVMLPLKAKSLKVNFSFGRYTMSGASPVATTGNTEISPTSGASPVAMSKTEEQNGSLRHPLHLAIGTSPLHNDLEEKNRVKKYYQRKQFHLTTDFPVPSTCGTISCKEHKEFMTLGADIALTVRRIMDDGSKLVTVSVTNSFHTPQMSKEQNEYALFQCELHLHSDIGFNPIYQLEVGDFRYNNEKLLES